MHQGWGRAPDVAVWITLGSGLLFTLVTTSRSIGEITQLNIEVSKRCDPLYGELS